MAVASTTPQSQARAHLLSLSPELLSNILVALVYSPPSKTAPDDLHDPECDLNPADIPSYRLQRAPSRLAAVLKTCKALRAVALPIAGSVLRLPEFDVRNGESTLKRLVRELEADRPRAEAVRDLTNLPGLVAGSRVYSVREVPGDSPAEETDLQLSLIRMCTGVRSVTLQLDSPETARQFGEALHSLDKLGELECTFDGPASHNLEMQHACLAALLSAFVGPNACADDDPPRRLSRLAFTVGGGFASETDLSSHDCDSQGCLSSRFPPGVTSGLDVNLTSDDDLDLLKCFLPGRGTTASGPHTRELRHLTLRLSPEVAAEQSHSIRTLLHGNRLESFDLHGFENVWYGAVSEYRPWRLQQRYADEIVGSLPRIRHLRMTHASGLSVSNLETLARTSPGLETLDLSDSQWYDHAAEFRTYHPPMLLSPLELAVTRQLERFPRLRFVNLGVWPFASQQRRPSRRHERHGLALWALERGIRLELLGCARSEKERAEWDEKIHGAIYEGGGGGLYYTDGDTWYDDSDLY